MPKPEISALSETDNNSNRFPYCWTGLCVVLFYVLVAGFLGQQGPPGKADEESYWKTAQEVAQAGGVATAPSFYISGRYRNAVQGPAYTSLLGAIATDKQPWRIGVGRALNVLWGVAALLISIWVLWRLHGRQVAIVGGLVLTLLQPLAYYSSIIACEPMLLAVFAGAWYFLHRSWENQKLAWAGAAALLLGAFLTKESGLIAFPAALAAATIARNRAFLLRQAPPLALCLMIGMVPVMLHNSRAYGKLWYSQNANQTWLDAWEETYTEGWQAKASPQAYFARHGAVDVCERLGAGLRTNLALLWSDLRPPLPRPVRSTAGAAFALLLWLGFALGMASHRHSGRWLDASLLLIFTALLAFRAPIAASARFYLPLFPVIGAYAAIGLIDMYRWAEHRGNWRVTRYGATAVAGAFVLLALAKAGGDAGPCLVRPWNLPIKGTCFGQTIDWIREDVPPGSGIVLGPTNTTAVQWFLEPGYHFKPLPSDARNSGELVAFAKRHRCRYIVLPADTFGVRGWQFSDFVAAKDGRLALREQPPPGLSYLGEAAAGGQALAFEVR